MSRELVRLEREQLTSGVYLDTPDEQTPLWKDGLNVIFHEDGPRPIKGFSQISFRASNRPVLGMKQVYIPEKGKGYIFYGTDDGLFYWEDGSETSTQVGSGYNADWWSFAQWGNWVFAANGRDKLQVWRGPNNEDGGFTSVPDLEGFEIEKEDPEDEDSDDLPLRPNVIATYQNMLVAFSPDGEGGEYQRIRACHPDDHLQWKPASDNQAVELIARDLFSSVRAATVTSRGIFFFGRTSGHMLSYVGPPFILGQEKIIDQVGIWGPNAVTNVNDQVFGIGPNGVFNISVGGSEEQGPNMEQQEANIRYVDRPMVRQHIRESLNREYADKSCVLFDAQQDVLIVGWPGWSYTLPSEGLALSLNTGGWCPIDFAPTGAAPAEVFDFASAGDRRGHIFWHGVETPTGNRTPSGARPELPFRESKSILWARYGILGYGQGAYGYEEE